MQKTVLVVEDEVLIALDLKQTLESHGWRVVGPAMSVAEALQLIDVELPLVALLDVTLGRDLVTPVASTLRERGVPFAVSSAYQRPEQIAGEALAAAPNVRKPFDEHHLLAVLDQLVSG